MRARSLTIVAAVLFAMAVSAAENGDSQDGALDLTMELMPADATSPEAVTGVIELPAASTEAAGQNAEDGLTKANEAREHREDGLATAEEALAQGQAHAEQSREDIGRGPPDPENIPAQPEIPDDLPGTTPENAGPPDTPGRPGN
jgi:hypothetical protein